ncbi:MAG TPA: branched-chain amino acid aminotransferase [bacterium]|nr:branched-chain amino acid aminotransferase [bacterium]
MLIYFDGKLIPKEEAKVSVYDHGLLYGDGIFEGIRSYDGKVFRLEQHLDRLYNSAQAIALKIPLPKEEIREAVLKTLRANKLRDAYIRLVVTRGIGDLGLDPRKCPKPTIFIITDKIVLYPEEFYKNGLEVIVTKTKRNIKEALNPEIKSLNYLNNILARIEVNKRGCQEGIMTNIEGYVAEATADNIFIVRNKDASAKGGELCSASAFIDRASEARCHNKEVITPPAEMEALRGITRDAVLKIAESLGIEAHELPFTVKDLYEADECFLTGTAAEVIPVVKVDGKDIGDGKPGEITLKLKEGFKKLTQREGTPIY